MPRTTFIVDDPMTRNGVLVRSRAPLETILVRTNDVTGEVEFDPDDITAHPRVAFQVPVASLETGIALMDDVMRSDRWLDASKQPVVRFTLGRVVAPTGRTGIEDGKTVQVQGEGILELRGMSVTVPVRADVTWRRKSEDTGCRLPGDLLHVAATFDVSLAAFGIDAHVAPQSRDKVAASLQVEADLFASTERPQVAADMQERLRQARKNLGQRLLGS